MHAEVPPPLSHCVPCSFTRFVGATDRTAGQSGLHTSANGQEQPSQRLVTPPGGRHALRSVCCRGLHRGACVISEHFLAFLSQLFYTNIWKAKN